MENLSAGGALVVADRLVDVGDRIKLVLGAADERFVLSAEVLRVERRSDATRAVAVVFRDVPKRVVARLEAFVVRVLERKRVRAPAMVLLIGLAPHERADLEHDLAVLGRFSMVAAQPVEAFWYLSDREYRVDVAIVDLDLAPATARALLRHLADEHPAIRRVAISAQPSSEWTEQPACHAVLPRPWRRGALARAISRVER